MRSRSAFLLLLGMVSASAALAHSAENAFSSRADLRIDEQRGLRVRTWFEVPHSSELVQEDADAVVGRLAKCLRLSLDGAPLAGIWRRGDDPKHGLSNGSHRLYALEFEPELPPAGDSLDVKLSVGCFPDQDLGFTASVRAKPPWRVTAKTLPPTTHSHSAASETIEPADREARRRAHVRFTSRTERP
ncbi:MAG: hypothetical protein MPN21_21980 [Thermoanaerobaculia bacterium]|nr:hypothetical protein [Thermoanaerobaculia bacterium]